MCRRPSWPEEPWLWVTGTERAGRPAGPFPSRAGSSCPPPVTCGSRGSSRHLDTRGTRAQPLPLSPPPPGPCCLLCHACVSSFHLPRLPPFESPRFSSSVQCPQSPPPALPGQTELLKLRLPRTLPPGLASRRGLAMTGWSAPHPTALSLGSGGRGAFIKAQGQ